MTDPERPPRNQDGSYPPPPPQGPPGSGAGWSAGYGGPGWPGGPPPPPRPQNGFGITALILGILGVLFGIIPLLFWLAGTLGVIALVLGVVGARRAKQRIATNGKMSVIGAVLGALAMVLAVVGVAIINNAFNDLERDLGGGGEPTPTVTDTPRTEQPSPTEEASEPPTADEALAFGGTWSYPDGLEVTVTSPTPHSPSDTAVGHSPGNTTMKVEVTVVNGTEERQTLDLVVVEAKDASGRAAEMVFDSPDVGEGLSGTLTPGAQSVATYAFDLPPDADGELTVEVTPDFDHDSALWHGPTP